MTQPAELIVAWIGRQTSPEAVAWFNAKRAGLAADSSPRAFASVFGSVVRRMGKGNLGLEPSDLAAAEKARPRWRPAGLTVDQAARIVLLVDAAKATGSFPERLKGLAASADLSELIATIRACHSIPIRTRLFRLRPKAAHRDADGLRSRSSSESVSGGELPIYAWNHMVLKTLFIDSVLHPIVGLDDRWNDELAGVLVNYAHERWAAHRPVTPELWRGVGPFADAVAIADLARVLVEGDPLEQRAAALALTASRDPAAAKALARRRDLADAVAAGEITWNDVRSQIPLT